MVIPDCKIIAQYILCQIMSFAHLAIMFNSTPQLLQMWVKDNKR